MNEKQRNYVDAVVRTVVVASSTLEAVAEVMRSPDPDISASLSAVFSRCIYRSAGLR